MCVFLQIKIDWGNFCVFTFFYWCLAIHQYLMAWIRECRQQSTRIFQIHFLDGVFSLKYVQLFFSTHLLPGVCRNFAKQNVLENFLGFEAVLQCTTSTIFLGFNLIITD